MQNVGTAVTVVLILSVVLIAGCTQSDTGTGDESGTNGGTTDTGSGGTQDGGTVPDEYSHISTMKFTASCDCYPYVITYRIRDYGTGAPDIRLDLTYESLGKTEKYILRGDEQMGWVYDSSMGEWMELGDSYDEGYEYSYFGQEWSSYYTNGHIEWNLDNLAAIGYQEGGSGTCSPGVDPYYSDIEINPTLDDSIFENPI